MTIKQDIIYVAFSLVYSCTCKQVMKKIYIKYTSRKSGLNISLCSFWSLHIQSLVFSKACTAIWICCLLLCFGLWGVCTTCSTYYHLREFRYVVACYIFYYIIRLTKGLVQQSWQLLITRDHWAKFPLGSVSGKGDHWNCFEIIRPTSGTGLVNFTWSTIHGLCWRWMDFW